MVHLKKNCMPLPLLWKCPPLAKPRGGALAPPWSKKCEVPWLRLLICKWCDEIKEYEWKQYYLILRIFLFLIQSPLQKHNEGIFKASFLVSTAVVFKIIYCLMQFVRPKATYTYFIHFGLLQKNKWLTCINNKRFTA